MTRERPASLFDDTALARAPIAGGEIVTGPTATELLGPPASNMSKRHDHYQRNVGRTRAAEQAPVAKSGCSHSHSHQRPGEPRRCSWCFEPV